MHSGRSCAGRQEGSALVVVLLALLLLAALGASMVTLTTADVLAASNQRDARAVLYAADAALELAADELVQVPDWNAVLAGTIRSARVDAGPSGASVMPDGRVVRIDELLNLANCGNASGCTVEAMSAVTAERRWGANNPSWRLFSSEVLGGPPPAVTVYTIVLVADDPAESDGRPDRDATPGTPGAGIVLLRALAFGPSGSRGALQACIERVVCPTGEAAPRFLSWQHPG